MGWMTQVAPDELALARLRQAVDGVRESVEQDRARRLADRVQASALTPRGTQVPNAAISDVAATKLTGNLTVTAAGSVKAGATAIATTATDGFVYIPAAAGPPTGTPTAVSGMVPVYFDSTNDAWYVYRSGWKSVTVV